LSATKILENDVSRIKQSNFPHFLKAKKYFLFRSGVNFKSENGLSRIEFAKLLIPLFPIQFATALTLISANDQRNKIYVKSGMHARLAAAKYRKKSNLTFVLM
jgi:hypothetical protein